MSLELSKVCSLQPDISKSIQDLTIIFKSNYNVLDSLLSKPLELHEARYSFLGYSDCGANMIHDVKNSVYIFHQ